MKYVIISALITLLTNTVVLGQLTDIGIINRGWAPYTKIPVSQADTLDLYILVKNFSTQPATNVVGSVVIDGNLYSSETLADLDTFQVDTINLGFWLPQGTTGSHTFQFTVSSTEPESQPNDNTTSYNIDYTNRVYAVDNGQPSSTTPNVSWAAAASNVDPPGFGNYFYFVSADTIAYVSMFIPDSVEGFTFSVDIYSGLVANTTWIGTSEIIDIFDGDVLLDGQVLIGSVGTWIDIPVYSPQGGYVITQPNEHHRFGVDCGSWDNVLSDVVVVSTNVNTYFNTYLGCASSSGVGCISSPSNFYLLRDSIAASNLCGFAEEVGTNGLFMIRPKLRCVSFEDTINITACDAITFDGLSYGSSGNYSRIYNDVNSCDSIIHLSIVVDGGNEIPSDICAVGVDENGNNRVVWEKPQISGIDSFYVYKESQQAGIYDYIGGTAYEDTAIFADVNANPSIQAYRYKISTVDSCGFESELSEEHKTIHLTINQGVGQDWNLIWSSYEGFEFLDYEIYRGTDPNSMSLLTTLASNLNSYTDQTAPSGLIYYQVVAINPNGCDPTRASAYASSKSNLATTEPSGINDVEMISANVRPNPSSNQVTITFNRHIKSNFRLVDKLGRVVLTEQLNSDEKMIDISHLPVGVYTILFDNENIAKGRVVKN